MIPLEIKKTIEVLDMNPVLAMTPFPFRGKPDFRGFTEEDYANFSGGLFVYDPQCLDPTATQPKVYQCKWIGGVDRLGDALVALLKLGFDCSITKPGVSKHWAIRWTMRSA